MKYVGVLDSNLNRLKLADTHFNATLLIKDFFFHCIAVSMSVSVPPLPR